MRPVDIFSRVLHIGDSDSDVLLGVFPARHPEKVGMVAMGTNGEVKKVIDKPSQTDLTHMWGMIVWRPSFTEHLHDAIHNQKILDFAEIMNKAISTGLRFLGVPIENGTYADLGTYEEIMQLERRQSSPRDGKS
jgi:glucose-1-phosphate thymidylyltransferase